MTKINVDIHKSGSENDLLLRMVANINEGKVKDVPNKNDVISYMAVRNAMFPLSSVLSFQVDEHYLHISEDNGKTFTLTLEWKEVAELSPIDKEIDDELTTANDLQNINI